MTHLVEDGVLDGGGTCLKREFCLCFCAVAVPLPFWTQASGLLSRAFHFSLQFIWLCMPAQLLALEGTAQWLALDGPVPPLALDGSAPLCFLLFLAWWLGLCCGGCCCRRTAHSAPERRGSDDGEGFVTPPRRSSPLRWAIDSLPSGERFSVRRRRSPVAAA
jgi:hypothetical protein